MAVPLEIENRSQALFLRGRCAVGRDGRTAMQTSRRVWNTLSRSRTGSRRIRQHVAEGTRSGPHIAIQSLSEFLRDGLYENENSINTMS